MPASQADRKYADIKLNSSISFTKEFKIDKDFTEFKLLSGDENPLHHDMEYSKKTDFLQPIVPMHLATLPLSSIAGMIFPGHRSLYLSVTINAIKPIYYNEKITYSAKVISKSDATNTLKIRAIIFKNNTVLLQAEQMVKVREDNIDHETLKKVIYHPVEIHQYHPRVLITGSSGAIGRSIALECARHGFDLVLHYFSNENSLNALVKQCHFYGVNVVTYQADLTKQQDRDNMILNLKNKSITHIIHTASTGLESGLDSLIASNYIALKQICDSLLSEMLSRQKGKIIFIGSSAIQHCPHGWEDYVAAKSAALSYINSINKNFQSYDINALTLSPGYVGTKFSDGERPKQLTPLLPEQVAETVMKLINVNHSASYYSLEFNSEQKGTYGFYPINNNDTSEINKKNSAMTQDYLSNDIKSKLDQTIKNYFQMDSDFKLDGTNFEFYPNWNSLKHIQFLLDIEKLFNLSVHSKMIGHTIAYDDLLKFIVHQKSDANV
jgi:short-subunit dehydrogenase/acyl dehydratase/acyl carrier protein